MIASSLSTNLVAAEPPPATTPPTATTNATQPRTANADLPRTQPKREPDKTIVFKKTPQTDLNLFLYLPSDWKASDQRPCIIFWFGGGFVAGKPAQFYTMAEYLSGRGLVCACAEYRVKNRNGNDIDKCVEDARSAMRWLKSHHAELGIDAQRVIASGGSAGGTLALLVTLGSDGPDAPGEDLGISPRPSALVLFNPAQGQPITDLASHAGEDTREACHKAIAGLNEPQRGLPPAIFFFGTADPLLAPSREFGEKSIALGNRVELWSAAGMSHSFFNRQPWHDATLRKADEFLTSLGYLQGEPPLPTDAKAVLKRELPK